MDGVPTAETTQKLYHNLDYLRGVEVFLNFIPAASMEGLRLGSVETVGGGAIKSNQAIIMDQLMDSNPLYLTGNTDTVYCFSFLDLEEDGPTVVEIPPGCGPGTVDDAFFRFVLRRSRSGDHESLLSTPGAVSWENITSSSVTLAELRLRWEWDPLRSTPRFQKILGGPEAKTVY